MPKSKKLKIEDAAPGHWISWKVFAGTDKEEINSGRILAIEDDKNFIVEYSFPAKVIVSKSKIVSVRKK